MLKKHISLLICAVFSFAYDISASKTVIMKIIPHTLITNINMTIEKKELNTLINTTSKIVKKSKKYCKSVHYNFSPRYEFKNKQKTFKGYKSSISAICIFPEEKIKEFTDLINSFSSDAEVSLSSIRYILTAEQKQNAQRALKIKAFKEARKDAQNLSKKLNMECFITNTSLAENITPPPRRMYPTVKKISVMSAPLEAPKSDNTYKLTIRYNIKCY
jgi:uncharacterized protein YggE